MNPWDALKPEHLTKQWQHKAEQPTDTEIEQLRKQVDALEFETDRDLGDETDHEPSV